MIIADDSDFVRDGLKIVLGVDSEFEVVGCAANGREAVNVLDDRVFEQIKDMGRKSRTGFDYFLFTQRELEIIEAVARGLANKEIAEKLFITEGTVKNYISNILVKTSLSHRTQIAIYYLTGKASS